MRSERQGKRSGRGDSGIGCQRRDRDECQSDLDGGVNRFGGDNLPIPFSIERRHRLVEWEENGEQCFGRKTSDVRVEAVEVKGI